MKCLVCPHHGQFIPNFLLVKSYYIFTTTTSPLHSITLHDIPLYPDKKVESISHLEIESSPFLHADIATPTLGVQFQV